MIDTILKTAGSDGATQTVPTRKTRVFEWHEYVIENPKTRELFYLDAIVATHRRWAEMCSFEGWNATEFNIVNLGPFLVATRARF